MRLGSSDFFFFEGASRNDIFCIVYNHGIKLALLKEMVIKLYTCMLVGIIDSVTLGGRLPISRPGKLNCIETEHSE